MATFDPLEERLCVRVVYDGAAGSGKTTNLRQLAALFASQRTTEVHTPAELEGRTLYFDWMEIQAGVVGGIPLLCQIISVPGQVVLSARRRHLLQTADVVVYVCDSSASALERARAGQGVLEGVARARASRIPLVLQANKQDQHDAVDGARLRAVLDRGDDVPCVEAIATDGIGVVDTFVTAIRTFSRAMQSGEGGAVRLEVRVAERREAALASVSAHALDPEWAAELLLEEASAAYQIDLAEAARRRTPLGAAGTEWALPSLPRADVPAGFIWPAHKGRTKLASFEARGMLSGRPTPEPSGRIAYLADGFVLETHTRTRHPHADSARQALVRAARERTKLEGLGVPDTVVVAQSASDGAWWIWTVRARLPTVAEVLVEGALDVAARRRLLDAFGASLAEALRTGTDHDFCLELSADAFGVDGERLRYVGDVGLEAPAGDAGAQVSAALAWLDGSADREAVLGAFERALRRQLSMSQNGSALEALLSRAP